MKLGFDVCLHNKRLNLDMPGLAEPARVTKVVETPPAPPTTGRPVFRCSPPVAWKTYALNSIAACHLLLLAWKGLPVWVGSLLRDSVLIMTPCIFIRDVSQHIKLQVLLVHLTGVFVYVSDHHRQQYNNKDISTAFYVVAVIVLALQIHAKHTRTRLHQIMTASACFAIVLGMIIKLVDIAWKVEFVSRLLDSCFLLVVAMSYASIEFT